MMPRPLQIRAPVASNPVGDLVHAGFELLDKRCAREDQHP
jgi:hypothetical protein